MSEQPDISDEAVQEATGRTWEEWFDTLDELGAGSMEHKTIASLLRERDLVDSGWWAQSVTVAYEKHTGQRITGQTKDTGFQVGTQKTHRLSADEAWDALTAPEAVELWLGDPAPDLQFAPGATVETENGYRLEVRTVAPGRRLRMRWTPPDRADPTTLQIYLQDKGEKTAIRFHHEGLADADERERMKRHWKEVLGQLETRLDDR